MLISVSFLLNGLKLGIRSAWNHHEKYIQISTKMPSIGLVCHEIQADFGIWEILRKLSMVKPMARVVVGVKATCVLREGV